MIYDLFNMAFLFFIVLDPPGNVPIFVGVLKHFDPITQRKIIIRELLISLGFMIIFLIFGEGFFKILNVSQASLQVAGGIILFIIAIPMIFASPTHDNIGKIPKDPLIVPLAVPAIAGPGILANITLYAGSGENKFLVFLAIFIAWLTLVPILLFSSYLKKLLGENGLTAVERLFGYLVVLLGAQMSIEGILASFAS